MYRSIGINRTGVTALCQIRGEAPEAIRGIEWIAFGSTAFDAMLPVYANVEKMPAYLSDVTLDTSTENFYWGSRLIAALADPNYAAAIQQIERYQSAVAVKGRQLIREYDRRMGESGKFDLMAEANEALCAMAKEQTIATLNKVLLTASEAMKNGYNRKDN
jgi:dipeptidase